MNIIELLESQGLIKKSSISGKYFSACAMNEEITIEINNIKKLKCDVSKCSMDECDNKGNNSISWGTATKGSIPLCESCLNEYIAHCNAQDKYTENSKEESL